MGLERGDRGPLLTQRDPGCYDRFSLSRNAGFPCLHNGTPVVMIGSVYLEMLVFAWFLLDTELNAAIFGIIPSRDFTDNVKRYSAG